MSARLFIRNDDVWTLDPEFRFFFDLAIDQGIPVVHAVIPGKLNKKMIHFLIKAKEKTPHLLDIVQHGWIHANYSLKVGTKYEFGASRALDVQRKDIEQGFKKMQQAFGDYFTPAFVPPYHGYDEATLKVLNENDFKIFSAGVRRAEGLKKFINVPAQVSFSSYEQGKKSMHKAQDVLGFLIKGINRRALSGLVMHHADFKTASNRRELVRFFNYVKTLMIRQEWQILLFSDLLRK